MGRIPSELYSVIGTPKQSVLSSSFSLWVHSLQAVPLKVTQKGPIHSTSSLYELIVIVNKNNTINSKVKRFYENDINEITCPDKLHDNAIITKSEIVGFQKGEVGTKRQNPVDGSYPSMPSLQSQRNTL